MSTSYVLIVFALVIVLMIVLISKCKVNAAMGILLSAFILAIALGTPWQDIEGTINSGFSGTIKSVAIASWAVPWVRSWKRQVQPSASPNGPLALWVKST